MNVEQLMSRNVKTCTTGATLESAAQMMWDGDCGCIPVVDASDHLVGIVTDRDICMAAYTQGARLCDLPVSLAMSSKVFACNLGDTIASAEAILRAQQIRRLPVVDDENQVVGVLSLNDIVREANRQVERKGKGNSRITAEEIAATFGAVCAHRSGELVPSAS